MPPRPEFTVIAGPNGAGKSRLSPFYIHGASFDGDLLSLNLRRDHPDWPERWISGSVAGELEKQKDAAISAHRDFAFETNFSSDMILEMIDEFRNAGYKITLYYFGLQELNESKYRVTQREQFGGHDVPNDVIEYNFTEGIRRVSGSLNLFDNITFIDGDSDYGTIVAIHIKSSGVHEVSDSHFPWFDTHFAAAFAALL